LFWDEKLMLDNIRLNDDTGTEHLQLAPHGWRKIDEVNLSPFQ
jgi:hypothetical protein